MYNVEETRAQLASVRRTWTAHGSELKAPSLGQLLIPLLDDGNIDTYQAANLKSIASDSVRSPHQCLLLSIALSINSCKQS